METAHDYCGIDLRKKQEPDWLLRQLPPGFDFAEYARRRHELASGDLLQAAGEEGSVRLRDVRDPQRYVLITPSLERIGGWRATRWDQYGPIGHTEHRTRRGALLCFCGAEDDCPAYGREWDYEVEKVDRPRKVGIVAREAIEQIPEQTVVCVRLLDGSEIEGSIQRTAGIVWLASANRETFTFEEQRIASVRVVRTCDQVLQEREQRRYGEPAYHQQPRTREQYEQTLWDLARQASEVRSKSLENIGSYKGFMRYLQIEAQFNRLADEVRLAKSKRRYMLATALIRAGGNSMPSPWDIADGPLDAMRYEVPRQSDFDPDPVRRRRQRTPKPTEAFERRAEVEDSLRRARVKLMGRCSVSKKAQMERIVARREKQLERGEYFEAVAIMQEAVTAEAVRP